jgi:hypothetical protein
MFHSNIRPCEEAAILGGVKERKKHDGTILYVLKQKNNFVDSTLTEVLTDVLVSFTVLKMQCIREALTFQSCLKTVTRNNCMRCFYLLFSRHVSAYTMAILKRFLQYLYV